MTPKERYLSVIRGEAPDYLPRIPILMQFAAEYIGSNYGKFASDHRVLVESNIRCAEDFGLDQLSAISDPYRETAAFGAEIIFHENSVPECAVPPFADFECEMEELENIDIPNPLDHERMRDRIDAIKLYKDRIGDDYSIMGWVEGPAALACDLRGMTAMLMDMIEEPEWCEALLDLCTETSIRFAEEQLKAGADTIGIGDAVCSQISPEIYNDLVWPGQKRLFEAIQDLGGLVRLHICGQTQHLWPKLTQLPIDIFDCDHMVDMDAARLQFGKNVILAGNLDPVSDIRFGELNSISGKIECCHSQAGEKFMVCAGCEIPSGTKAEILKKFCEPISG